MALDVFEHVPDYLGFLRQMAAISTYQVYDIPLDWSIRSTLQPGLLIQLRERIGHLHYFNRETALASLRDTGHEVVGWRWHSPAQAARGFKGAVRRSFFATNEELCVNVMGGFAMTVLCRSKSA